MEKGEFSQEVHIFITISLNEGWFRQSEGVHQNTEFLRIFSTVVGLPTAVSAVAVCLRKMLLGVKKELRSIYQHFSTPTTPRIGRSVV
jgi:hypothetical protein